MTLNEFIHKLKRRLLYSFKKKSAKVPLLEMVWEESSATDLPLLLPEGYELRQFKQEDADSYYQLFAAADMEKPPLDYWDEHLLPNGFFVIEHLSSQTIVAACFASHHPVMRHPRGGNLGWLAVHPLHRGKKLGHSVAAAVTKRLLTAGYQRIYLETHDFRLPAIVVYLKMGWLPLLYLPEMETRWQAICQTINWPFEPQTWPH